MREIRIIEGVCLQIDKQTRTITVNRGRGNIIEHYSESLTDKEVEQLIKTIAKENKKFTSWNLTDEY